jgi:hypothetical protein
VRVMSSQASFFIIVLFKCHDKLVNHQGKSTVDHWSFDKTHCQLPFVNCQF